MWKKDVNILNEQFTKRALVESREKKFKLVTVIMWNKCLKECIFDGKQCIYHCGYLYYYVVFTLIKVWDTTCVWRKINKLNY